MRNIKEINIKNRTYYFFKDMINIKDFDSSLLKIDKMSYKNISIYNIGYITIKKIDCMFLSCHARVLAAHLNHLASLVKWLSVCSSNKWLWFWVQLQSLKKIDGYENIYSVDPLYLMIGEVIGHIEENNGNKYLVFDSSDENKEVLKNTKTFGMGLKIKLRS